MQLFDLLHPKLFKLLSGKKQALYADILMLIWGRCYRARDYGIEKTALAYLLEEYLAGLALELVLEEGAEDEPGAPSEKNPHVQSLWLLAQLRDTGWLEDVDGGYQEEMRTVIRPIVVPLLQALDGMLNPQTVTYSGKLSKAYQLLKNIGNEKSPYENVVREISADMTELNNALRQLNASIGTFLDQLTHNKTPQEVLELFEQYEEKVVVAAYHRFKTSDNLFNYRAFLHEGLDDCAERYFEILVADFSQVEQVSEGGAVIQVRLLLRKLQDDLDDMGELIHEIDRNHIIYRQRAVQRAQFLLLSDGSAQGRINTLLRYYASEVATAGDLFTVDESPLSHQWKLYPTSVVGKCLLKPPITSRESTPIEPLRVVAPLAEDVLQQEQAALLQYAKEAVTVENVNRFVDVALQQQQAIRASALSQDYPSEFAKIIGLHTYSQLENRSYEIELGENLVCHAGYNFKDFVLRKKG